ncbi:MAG: response regulator [Nostocales cyanobacterium]|nr:MAG: response regulator [Nostocales cyanobacterium]
MYDDSYNSWYPASNNSGSNNLMLIIEDSEYDYEMLIREVKKSQIECKTHRCETGEEGLDYLQNRGEYQDKHKFIKPSLVLLDLNLPGTDGKEILANIKLDPVLKLIPVVVFSTSTNSKDIEYCYQKGVNAYIVKPMNIPLFQEYIKVLLLHWLKLNTTYIDTFPSYPD